MTWILRWESVHPFYRIKALFDGHKRRDILGSDYQKILGICKNKVIQVYYWEEDLKRKAKEAKTIFLDKERIRQFIHFAQRNAQELVSLSKQKNSNLQTIVHKLEVLLCTYDLSRPEYVDNIPRVSYTFPATKTVLNKEQEEWHNIKQKYDHGKDVSQELKRHAQKYGWMGAAEQERPWNLDYYRQLLQQNLKKKKQKTNLTLVEKLGELRLMLRLAWVESGYLLKGKLTEKPTTYAFLLDNDTLTFYDKNELNKVESMIKSEIKQVSIIQGRVAYPGKVKGRVRLIDAWTVDQTKAITAMKEGEILVTGMTRPHLIHAISKAGAIVTDEGGIASHAAIICRELKKPCVIGTKIATKVLKDGDIVEVDAERGIIRKII